RGRTVWRAGGRVARRRRAPRTARSADVVRHTVSQPIQLAMVRRRLDADHRSVLVDGPGRGPALLALDARGARRAAAERRHRVAADGGQLRPARLRASGGARAGAAAVRTDAPAAMRSGARTDRAARRLAATGAVAGTRGPPLPGRDRGDPNLHLPVRVADHRAHGERRPNSPPD